MKNPDTKYLLLLAMLSGALALACSNRDLPTTHKDAPHPGMAKIPGNGQCFRQGWDDSMATADERPGMRSCFSYDYWLDTTEVTQKKYAELMGERPVSDSSRYGIGDDYPVYYVSWFDAVLFCNARSVAEGLDTVYHYSQKAIVSGAIIGLTGLTYDLSCDGYRLPTESEWEFAARGGASIGSFTHSPDSSIAGAAAWHAANSRGRTHPVATKSPNLYGLYDMAGNVFEWSNDWKCAYSGDDIVNSLGGIQPGSSFEKVIKGGSFNGGLSFLRPSRRGAMYPTALSASNEYVGFRCARGPVPGGSYIRNERQTFSPSPVSIVMNSGDVKSFFRTSDVKIVFVNVTGESRTLCYVDFGLTFPYVREFTDDRSVFLPSISPDGRLVAYCSGNVGMSGPSKITIRSLDSLGSPKVLLAADSAYCPRWWLDRSSGQMHVVYTNSAIPNDNPAWATSRTYMQNIVKGLPAAAPLALTVDGGFHGGLSLDRRYLVSGYTRLLLRELATNEQRQLFVFPHNGKSASGSTQACNASISPDTGASLRCMFLDFGYSGTSAITGTGYGIHQVLFVATLTDSVTAALHCPPAEASWDNPRWSNQPAFAISCCRDGGDRSKTVYFVDVVARRCQPALTGFELEQPDCRIGLTEGAGGRFFPDSLGAYDDPHFVYGQTLFSYMMHLFWRKCPGLDAVFVGNSQIQAGVDCGVLQGKNAVNIAFPGCGLSGTYTIISDYVLPHASRVRCIGVNVPLYFYGLPLAESSPEWWSSTIGSSKGFTYDRNHGFWRDSLSEDFKKAIYAQDFYHAFTDADTFGHTAFPCNGWGGQAPEMYDFPEWSVNDSIYGANFASFVNLVQLVSSRRIHLIAINFPESPAYKNTDHFNIAVKNWNTGKAAIAHLKALEERYPYFHLYDAYQDGNHDYTDADARDWNHLCPSGAEKLTRRLDSLIDSLLRQ